LQICTPLQSESTTLVLLSHKIKGQDKAFQLTYYPTVPVVQVVKNHTQKNKSD